MEIASLTSMSREGCWRAVSAPRNWPPRRCASPRPRTRKTNAYLHFSPERALAAARRVDEKIARGEDPGPLAGVPVAVKDVIVTQGVRTTCGSKLLAELHSAV